MSKWSEALIDKVGARVKRRLLRQFFMVFLDKGYYLSGMSDASPRPFTITDKSSITAIFDNADELLVQVYKTAADKLEKRSYGWIHFKLDCSTSHPGTIVNDYSAILHPIIEPVYKECDKWI